VWKLPVLKTDLTITGVVLADIYAATTGTDNDMVVKLIDQYPEDDPDAKMRGYQLMTNAEIFRGRYLDSFERPAPLGAGSIREYKFSLHDVDHVFKAGHTVMVGDSEHLVSALRPEPTNVCAQYHEGEAGRLQAGDHHDLFRAGSRLECSVARDEPLRTR